MSRPLVGVSIVWHPDDAMELQPLVGSDCASCGKRILVAFDATNCERCGLALHTDHVEAHAPGCTGRPAIARTARDYDETAPFSLTRLVASLFIAAAFVAAFGFGLLSASPSIPDGSPDTGAAKRTTVAWIAVATGVALALAGAVAGRPRRAD